jgi:hypothetical protein
MVLFTPEIQATQLSQLKHAILSVPLEHLINAATPAPPECTPASNASGL